MLQHVSVYINHHQGDLSLCFAKVTVLTSVTYRYLKLSLLWLHVQHMFCLLRIFVVYSSASHLPAFPLKFLFCWFPIFLQNRCGINMSKTKINLNYI